MGAQVVVSESTRPSGDKSCKVGGSARAASFVARLVGAGAAAAFLSGGAYAASVCATGSGGTGPMGIEGNNNSIKEGCGSGAYLPAGHDVAEIEAAGSKVYVDGTANTVNLQAGGGQTVTINSAGVIQNVGGGAVNSTSKDAVNGSELYSNAASTAAALGGGAKVATDGTIVAPAYTVDGKTVNNVGDAISNLDGRVAKNTTDLEKNTVDIEKNTADIADLNNTVVKYDSPEHDRVTLGGSADAPAVKLSNLQDGELSAASTDAVTGAQLSNTNQNLADLTQSVKAAMSVNTADLPAPTASGTNAVAFGGGAQASGDNSAAIGGGAQASGDNSAAIGGGAQASGDNSAAFGRGAQASGANSAAIGGGAQASGANSAAFGGGAQASGVNSVAIGAGSMADQANTFSVGSQGNERRITNVADGQGPTDAVNMRQFQSGLGSVARSAYSGVAAATALTMIPEVDSGKTLAVGVAGGSYKGYQAMALGASARVTANLKVKIGAGISAADTTYGAGASYQW